MQDFWSWAPPELVEARDRSTNASNLLRTFMLGLSPDDVQPDGIPACVVRDEKCCTTITILRETYKEFVTNRYGCKVPPGVQEFSESALLGENGIGGRCCVPCLSAILFAAFVVA